jgi:hypothetical protein
MYDVHKYLHNYSPTQLNLLVSERHVSAFLERHLQVFYWTSNVLECMYVSMYVCFTASNKMDVTFVVTVR